MPINVEYSLLAKEGETCEEVTAATVSVQSEPLTEATVVVTPVEDVYFRQGANPVAVATGADQLLLGGVAYRVEGIVAGYKLAFIRKTTTGLVHLSPNS